jgi:hypothetical protein
MIGSCINLVSVDYVYCLFTKSQLIIGVNDDRIELSEFRPDVVRQVAADNFSRSTAKYLDYYFLQEKQIVYTIRSDNTKKFNVTSADGFTSKQSMVTDTTWRQTVVQVKAGMHRDIRGYMKTDSTPKPPDVVLGQSSVGSTSRSNTTSDVSTSTAVRLENDYLQFKVEVQSMIAQEINRREANDKTIRLDINVINNTIRDVHANFENLKDANISIASKVEENAVQNDGKFKQISTQIDLSRSETANISTQIDRGRSETNDLILQMQLMLQTFMTEQTRLNKRNEQGEKKDDMDDDV